MTARYVTRAVLRELEPQLTESDETVLKRVSDLRFVTGDQLRRMHFADADQQASARAARRALLRLTRLDCLQRLPRQVGGVRRGSAAYVYYLGPAGQRLAMDRGWKPQRRTRGPQIPGTLFLAHSLQVAELHTLLIDADRSRHIELLQLNHDYACWRGYDGAAGQRSILKPDSYVRLGVGDYEDSYFIEVDMGTEGSSALERKLRQYIEYEATGREQAEHGVFPMTLWLTPDAKRAEAIAACIERLPEPSRGLFAVAPFTELLPLLGTGEQLTGLPTHEKMEVRERG